MLRLMKLLGIHLRCVLPVARPGGVLILSAAPASDEGVGLRSEVEKLVAEGVVEVLKEEYIPRWYREEKAAVVLGAAYIPRWMREDDGTLWVLRKKI
mmetsp:Transcript_14232/g.22439  ORF Transcript_14232/g.22439 Transcript_14232/m.22439 type:complete len:97 (-) Transcript_14232:247-537(-)